MFFPEISLSANVCQVDSDDHPINGAADLHKVSTLIFFLSFVVIILTIVLCAHECPTREPLPLALPVSILVLGQVVVGDINWLVPRQIINELVIMRLN